MTTNSSSTAGIDPDQVHTQRSARLLRSTGDTLEMLTASLRSELAIAGPVSADVEAAIGRVVGAAVELRNAGSRMEARGE